MPLASSRPAVPDGAEAKDGLGADLERLDRRAAHQPDGDDAPRPGLEPLCGPPPERPDVLRPGREEGAPCGVTPAVEDIEVGEAEPRPLPCIDVVDDGETGLRGGGEKGLGQRSEGLDRTDMERPRRTVPRRAAARTVLESTKGGKAGLPRPIGTTGRRPWRVVGGSAAADHHAVQLRRAAAHPTLVEKRLAARAHSRMTPVGAAPERGEAGEQGHRVDQRRTRRPGFDQYDLRLGKGRCQTGGDHRAGGARADDREITGAGGCHCATVERSSALPTQVSAIALSEPSSR